MKTAKKAKENLAVIEKQSQTQTTEIEQSIIEVSIDCDLQNFVNSQVDFFQRFTKCHCKFIIF